MPGNAATTHLVDIMEAHLDRKITETAVEQLYTYDKVAGLLSVDLTFAMDPI